MVASMEQSRAWGRYDRDYLEGSQQQGNYYYLDPNYTPAS